MRIGWHGRLAMVMSMTFYRVLLLALAISGLACFASLASAESGELPPPLSEAEAVAFAKRYAAIDASFAAGEATSQTVTDEFALDAELFIRTTGLDTRTKNGVLQLIKPADLSDGEFKQRRCNHQLALGQIFPQGRNDKTFQLIRKSRALGAIRFPEVLRYVTDIIECGASRGNLESRYMAEALAWAKELDKADPTTLRRLETQHQELTNGIFDNIPPAEYHKVIKSENQLEKAGHQALAYAFGSLAAKKERELAKTAASTDKPAKELDLGPTPSADVWFQAMRGDIKAQMEMAATYETGYPGFRNAHHSYYWYYTAWKNGAGTAARDGANRTRTTLTEPEKIQVDKDIANKQHPTLY